MPSSTGRRAARMPATILACGLALSLGMGARAPGAPTQARVAERVFGDPAKPIEVQAGQLFLVALAANPSTGYHWTVATPPDAHVVVLRGAAYQATKMGLMGAPGQELRVYEAVGAGKATISLNYVSPGSEQTVGKTVQFKVVAARADAAHPAR
jgi:predicted secreted protein